MPVIIRLLLLLSFVVAPAGALAQPTGDVDGAPEPPADDTAQPALPEPPPPAVDEPTGDAQTLRKTCVAAMNADPAFADSIIKTAEKQLADQVQKDQVLKDLCTVYQHTQAQDDIATNQRHVILAYAAMWIIAAGFVVFLWRRQMALKAEIAQLRRELDAAASGDDAR
jgi:hypothetical protein